MLRKEEFVFRQQKKKFYVTNESSKASTKLAKKELNRFFRETVYFLHYYDEILGLSISSNLNNKSTVKKKTKFLIFIQLCSHDWHIQCVFR